MAKKSARSKGYRTYKKEEKGFTKGEIRTMIIGFAVIVIALICVLVLPDAIESRHLLKVKYISLVNLVADHEVVRELVADELTLQNLQHELNCILDHSEQRARMLEGYRQMRARLGEPGAPRQAARLIVDLLKGVTHAHPAP